MELDEWEPACEFVAQKIQQKQKRNVSSGSNIISNFFSFSPILKYYDFLSATVLILV